MSKHEYAISINYLNRVYMSYLLPYVEYASVLWNECSDQDSKIIQNIQNEAVRLVTGLTRSVSLENLKNMWMDKSIHREICNNYILCIMVNIFYWLGAFIFTIFNSSFI